MAVEEVGLENLPNLYISEIVLSNKFLSKTSDSDATSISVSFVVSDYEQTNGMLAWFDYELFSKYMRVIVVQSTSAAFSDNITNGDAELLPFSFQKLASYTPEQVEFQTLKLKTNQSAPGGRMEKYTQALYTCMNRLAIWLALSTLQGRTMSFLLK